MTDAYLTIREASEGLYKEKGSKFLAYAYPVENEEEIKEILQALKKKYYDATHHCYAYKLGVSEPVLKASDAGEPAHSAGTPILNQIRSKGVTNVLVVVVRYYGGTKLGVSGLISAYKAAAEEALNKANVVEKYLQEEATIQFSFDHMNEVMSVLKSNNTSITGQDYAQECTITFSARKSEVPKILGKLSRVIKVV